MHQLADMGFRQPAAALRPLVSAYYWLAARDGPVDEYLHPEWTNVRIALAGQWRWQQVSKAAHFPTGMTIFGPSSCAARISAERGAAVLGFGLLPLGLARLVGVPAGGLANGFAPLADVWGPDADAMGAALRATADPDEWARILDAVLLERLAMAPPAHPLVALGHRALAEGRIDTVEAFAVQLGVSVRTLERLSARLFGFGPKSLLRRQRFLRTLDAVQKAPPGAVLAEHLGLDYADQSHFVREFRAFMGMTPSEYLRLPRVVMRRAAAAREQLMGETMQVLQVPR